MCGLAALLSYSGPQPLADALVAMTNRVRYRGPDGEGYATWRRGALIHFFGGADTSPEAYSAGIAARPSMSAPGPDAGLEVGLGHRRLAVQEPSIAGHQPMSTADRITTIVFNGEIYNHQELTAELRALGHRFLTRTDTEVVLAAYRQWGTDCLRRLNGMFAFVIFDAPDRRVFAARDRFGVKPCYLWSSPFGFLALASEIKQFGVLPGWRAQINEQCAYDYLKYGLTDHENQTLFADVMQLRGGEFLEARLEDLGNFRRHIRRWYSLSAGAVSMNLVEAGAHFRDLFADAVRLRLPARPAVGASLSGGVDSSSIVCVANSMLRSQQRASEPVSFSACSDMERYDERRHVEKIVRHTDVSAHYVYPALDECLDSMSKIVWHHDEPFAGASIFAEWKVFELAAQSAVQVTLEGHGADELLGGYHTFFAHNFARLWRERRWLDLGSGLAQVRAIHGMRTGATLARMIDLNLPKPVRAWARRYVRPIDRSGWLSSRMTVDKRNPNLGIDAEPSVRAFSIDQLLRTSLPSQLHWCDRDSMAHSIESRAPFLDYRVVEFALACPDEFKLRGSTTKVLLREAVKQILPADTLARRDKMGFVTPEEHWIREHQPNRFLSLAKAATERADGVVNGEAFKRAERIIKGRERFDLFVWRLILFSTWLDRFEVCITRPYQSQAFTSGAVPSSASQSRPSETIAADAQVPGIPYQADTLRRADADTTT